MHQTVTLFISTFTTLLAIINPLEALPVFMELTESDDVVRHRQVARESCFYALVLLLFFFLFGTLVLRIFGVPLSMVRIVGGIILCKIGFELFGGSASSVGKCAPAVGGKEGNIAFVPLAMPIMCGPGAIATVLGMTSQIRHPEFEIGPFVAIVVAIFATMGATYLALANAQKLLGRIGPMGIDATTRIIGFFVSAMGVGLVFQGAMEALKAYGVLVVH
jgi:multiple antibiotic resistance protein